MASMTQLARMTRSDAVSKAGAWATATAARRTRLDSDRPHDPTPREYGCRSRCSRSLLITAHRSIFCASVSLASARRPAGGGGGGGGGDGVGWAGLPAGAPDDATTGDAIPTARVTCGHARTPGGNAGTPAGAARGPRRGALAAWSATRLTTPALSSRRRAHGPHRAAHNGAP
jgi:hypothetical protein